MKSGQLSALKLHTDKYFQNDIFYAILVSQTRVFTREEYAQNVTQTRRID